MSEQEKQEEKNCEETKTNHEQKNCHCGKHEHHQNCEHKHECDHHKNCREEKIKQLEEKSQEYLSMAQLLQADFDNFRKKVDLQVKTAKNDGMIMAIKTIIPSLDSFKQAKKLITDEKILQGVDMIESDILSALNTLGVEKIECVGKEFDPNFHNALTTQNNPDFEDNIIIDEYQAGYKLGEKIIRYSQVIVNKREEN